MKLVVCIFHQQLKMCERLVSVEAGCDKGRWSRWGTAWGLITHQQIVFKHCCSLDIFIWRNSTIWSVSSWVTPIFPHKWCINNFRVMFPSLWVCALSIFQFLMWHTVPPTPPNWINGNMSKLPPHPPICAQMSLPSPTAIMNLMIFH